MCDCVHHTKMVISEGAWWPEEPNHHPSFAHILRARQIYLTALGHIWHSRLHRWRSACTQWRTLALQSNTNQPDWWHSISRWCAITWTLANYKQWSGLKRKGSLRRRWVCQTLDGQTPAESQTAHCCCRLTQQVLQETLLEVNTRDWPIALCRWARLGVAQKVRCGSL